MINNNSILCVYDFDHTLVDTDCKIRLKSDGTILSQEKYEIYVKSRSIMDRQIFDFDDYDRIINPKPILKVVERLLSDIKNGYECWILTARQTVEPIKQYLSSILSTSVVQVKAINDKNCLNLNKNDHEKKAEWVNSKLLSNYEQLFLYEDSFENAQAINNLQKSFKNTKFNIFLVDQSGDQVEIVPFDDFQRHKQGEN